MAPPNRPNFCTAFVWAVSVALKVVHQLDAYVRSFHGLLLPMSRHIIDSMNTITIHEKGIDWLVSEDARIFRPQTITKTKRSRFGNTQTFESIRPQTEIKPWIDKRGYHIVSAKLGDKRPKMFVHRLVALAFVSGFEPGLSVNHINGNKLDNRPENLEWVTLAENTKHQWRTGLVDLRGENAPGHKLTQRQVIHIRRALRLGVPGNSLAIISGVSASTIHLIEKGERWASIPEE
jgi:hypothetical protein